MSDKRAMKVKTRERANVFWVLTQFVMLLAVAACSSTNADNAGGDGGNGGARTSVTSGGGVEDPGPPDETEEGENARLGSADETFVVAPPTNATACTSNAQCPSGFCVDGYCCDSKCDTTCMACSAAKKGSGADGVCGSIAYDKDPDNDCPNGACDGTNQCKNYNGVPCTTTTECLSNYCVDGVCCGNVCTGICNACTNAKKGGGYDGVCGNIANASDPDNECTPGECNGSGTCNQAQPLLVNGAVCVSGGQCSSGNCVDGVCCDTACGGACKACTAAKKGSGSDGTCGNIRYDSDPDNECIWGACSGNGTCQSYNGVPCTQTTQCLSNYCVDGVCCGNVCTGTCAACTTAKKGSGYDGVCGNIANASDPDNECNPGECNGSGTCNQAQVLLANGAACMNGGQCSSGNCVDGVCCDTACGEACKACTAAKKGSGANGTCGNIQNDSDPDNECAAGACSGNGTCQFYNGVPCTQTTQCLSNYCVDGVCCGNVCTGTCAACTTAKKGSGYDGVCGNIANASDPDNECNPGECNGSGTCNQSQVLLANGAACMNGGQCSSGNCVDGVCCDTACGEACKACTAAKKGSGANGTCGNIQYDSDPDNECAGGACSGNGACQFYNGVPCAQTTECLSNYCVDSVCCGNICTGTCSACSTAKKGSGYDGVCGAIANNSDPDNECDQMCDGTGACQKAPNGSSCIASSDCASGNCVDGFCCDTSCVGTCQACSAAKKGSGSDGSCGLIAADTDPDNECALGKCDGAGVCTMLAANGSQCSNDLQCGSEHCVDGVCCDTACTGACVACHLPGTVGTCTPIAVGQSDPNGVPACLKVCDGNGGCVKNHGETCSGGSDCLSRVCSRGICEVPQGPVGPLAWATFSDTAFLNPGQNPIVQLEQVSASFSPGGPILIDGKIPDNTGRNLVLDGSFTSRGYPAFYDWEPTDGSNSPIWRRLGRGGVRAWYQNYFYSTCWGGWPGSNGPGFTSVILGANDAGQFGAIVSPCGSSAIDFGDGIPTFGTHLVRYRSGVGLELRTSPPSNLAEPVMLGPNAEMHSLTVANNTLTLVKLNADTTPAWTKTVTGTISTSPGYDVDAQGNIFIIFGFSGSVNFGAGPLTAVGMYNTGFVKLDPMGNVIWQKRFDAHFSPKLARAGSGDAAISGLAMPSVDLGAGPVPGYFIAKFSSSGSLLWTVSGVNAFGLTADPLGGVYAVVHVGGGGYNPWNIPFPGRGIGMIKYKECPGPLGCKAYGASCTNGDQCGSGSCVDGVCCDSDCSGTCSACTAAKKGYGEDGTCQAIAIGNDPDGECVGGVCNGSGNCALDAGAACTENSVCTTGFCVDGVCCNEACSGICQACTATLKGSGSDGTCGGIAMGTDPATECAGGTCSGTIGCSMAGNGAICTSGNQCASGHCVDGICCDSACSGTCDACTAAKKGYGSDGTCGAIANGSDPDNECVNGACDGASTCRFNNAQVCSGDTQCLSGFCVDGYCCNNACNGTCVACSNAKKGNGQNGTCGNIVKGSDPDAECGGLTCNGVGDCMSPNGDVCSTSAECASNYCRDGVCCNTACNGTCLACSAAKKGQGLDGTCEPIASGIDPDNECPNSTCDGSGICTPIPCMANNECPSGICSNGFCAGYILDVEVNQFRSCAIFVDGTVKCWGNAAGLGLNASNVGDNANEMGSNLPFLPMGTGRIVKELGCGYRFQCALTTAGQVVCWGYNDYEQLGRGDQAVPDTYAELGDNLQVVNFGAGRTAVQIASGGLHSCALLDNGAVKCWGYNAYGQLGYGDKVNRGWSASEMGDNLPAVDLGTGRTAIAVSVEEYNSCALLDNGTVKCWGINGTGQLGQGDTITRGDNPGEMGDNLLPINLGTGKTAVQISLGRGHACARLNDQTVKCWGNNVYGALGLGTTDVRGDQPGEMGDNLPAINLGTGRIAVDVNAAEWFTCALLDDSTLKCWGAGAPAAENGTWSNLGDQPGEMGDNLAPVNLGTGKTVIRFNSRWAHSCAVLNDGSVKCWGYNINGQLGLGNTANTAATGDNLPVVSLY